KILRHRHVRRPNLPPSKAAQADVEANWLQIAILANEKIVCAALVHHLAISSGKQYLCPIGVQHRTFGKACNPYGQINGGSFVSRNSSASGTKNGVMVHPFREPELAPAGIEFCRDGPAGSRIWRKPLF